MAPKATFVSSESPVWPNFPLSCFSFGAQRIMVSNGPLIERPLVQFMISSIVLGIRKWVGASNRPIDERVKKRV